MAISCEPNDLAAAITCFDKLSALQLEQVKTYLLAVIAGGSTDPETLMASAKCFNKFSFEQLLEVQTYLLCQIANA
jgi:hypothetical protein